MAGFRHDVIDDSLQILAGLLVHLDLPIRARALFEDLERVFHFLPGTEFVDDVGEEAVAMGLPRRVAFEGLNA